MLLNILQCTQQPPTTKNCLVQSVSDGTEKPHKRDFQNLICRTFYIDPSFYVPCLLSLLPSVLQVTYIHSQSVHLGYLQLTRVPSSPMFTEALFQGLRFQTTQKTIFVSQPKNLTFIWNVEKAFAKFQSWDELLECSCLKIGCFLDSISQFRTLG